MPTPARRIRQSQPSPHGLETRALLSPSSPFAEIAMLEPRFAESREDMGFGFDLKGSGFDGPRRLPMGPGAGRGPNPGDFARFAGHPPRFEGFRNALPPPPRNPRVIVEALFARSERFDGPSPVVDAERLDQTRRSGRQVVDVAEVKRERIATAPQPDVAPAPISSSPATLPDAIRSRQGASPELPTREPFSISSLAVQAAMDVFPDTIVGDGSLLEARIAEPPRTSLLAPRAMFDSIGSASALESTNASRSLDIGRPSESAPIRIDRTDDTLSPVHADLSVTVVLEPPPVETVETESEEIPPTLPAGILSTVEINPLPVEGIPIGSFGGLLDPSLDPAESSLTGPVVLWRSAIVLAVGEAARRFRSSRMRRKTPAARRNGFFALSDLH